MLAADSRSHTPKSQKTAEFFGWFGALLDRLPEARTATRIERATAMAKGYEEMALRTTPWNVQDHLTTPQDCASYVQAAIDEVGDDSAFIVKALGQVARSRGIAAVARDTGMTREGLYNAIGETGNPSFATVVRLIRALGLEIRLAAVREDV